MLSVNNMVKQFSMQAKWESDKISCNFHKKEKKREDMTRDELMLEDFKRRLENERQNSEYTAIYNKIAGGADLSPEELNKLREKNPQAYNEYMADKAEEKSYEKKLRGCRTKEDVDRLHANKISAENTKFMSIVNDPNIPKSEKFRQAMRTLGKITNLSKIVKAFKESKEYKDLPTDEELKEAQKEKNEEFIPEEEKKENANDAVTDIPVKKPEEDKTATDISIAASGSTKPDDAVTDEDAEGIENAATAEKEVKTDTAINDVKKPLKPVHTVNHGNVEALESKVISEIKAHIKTFSSKSDRLDVSV